MNKTDKIPEQLNSENPQQISVDVVNVVSPDAGLDDSAAASMGQEDQAAAGAPEAAAEENLLDVDEVKSFIKLPFAMASAYFGEYWELKEAEAKAIAMPATSVFNRLFAKYMDKNPDVYMLCIALIIAIAPRVNRTIKEKEETAEKQEAQGKARPVGESAVISFAPEG